MKIKRICKQCNKEYETYEYNNLYFCSIGCLGDWRRGKTYYELYKNAEEMYNCRKGKRYSPSTEFKEGWNETKEGKEMILKRAKILGKEQSKAEELAIRIIKENNLPFTFVGKGDLMVGTKIPDFVYDNDGRKIIEIYSDYWHREDIVKYWHQTEDGAKEYYSVLGYNCLVIWERELKNVQEVIKKIKDFIDSTLEIVDIPLETLDRIKELSKSQFNGDTGMLLKDMLDKYLENHAMNVAFFENMDYKLNNILENISQTEKSSEEGKTEINLLSGRRIELKGGKKNE